MMSSTEDRISSLPDALISHILSFVPTKDAAATSVLSKQWTPLWKSVLTLDIRDENFKGTDSFRQFLHSFVVMRDATLPIRQIRCTITATMSENLDRRDLNRFVQEAAQRGLEIFELYVFTSKKVPCLFGVLSCKTLVFLKLAYMQVPEVPNLVDLPLLKTLHLYMTKFTGSFVQFMNLLQGCPILEDLLFTYKVTLPHIPSDFVEVEEFKGLSKLVRANIWLEESFEETFLFPWLYNVKFLGVVLTSNCFYRIPPTFHNLTHMVLEFPFYSIHYYSQCLNWELVIQVLQHCPNLQNLTIHEDYPSCMLPTEGDDWTEPETIPECLSSQLTKCSVTGFRGMECQLHFAEYILLNSKLLCTMAVETDGPLDSGEKLQLLKKLSSYPRSSGTCKLLFDRQ